MNLQVYNFGLISKLYFCLVCNAIIPTEHLFQHNSFYSSLPDEKRIYSDGSVQISIQHLKL